LQVAEVVAGLPIQPGIFLPFSVNVTFPALLTAADIDKDLLNWLVLGLPVIETELVVASNSVEVIVTYP
jgi:hypothetical protein